MSDDGFPSAEEIAALAGMEMDLFGGPGGKTPKAMAQAVFERGAVDAAMTITNLARHAPNENTRLRAAQYITDRVMGPVTTASQALPGEKDPLEEAMDTFAAAVAAEKNGDHSS